MAKEAFYGEWLDRLGELENLGGYWAMTTKAACNMWCCLDFDPSGEFTDRLLARWTTRDSSYGSRDQGPWLSGLGSLCDELVAADAELRARMQEALRTLILPAATPKERSSCRRDGGPAVAELRTRAPEG